MKIVIGSTSEVKRNGVVAGLARLPFFNGAEYYIFDAPSGVREQPWGTDEIHTGAINRAIAAYESGRYDLGIGIESGVELVDVRRVKAGIGVFLNRTACSIFDGNIAYPGESISFGLPYKVFDKMVDRRGLTLHEALVLEGIVDPKSRKGAIDVLSGGEIDRTKLVEEATHTAGMLLGNKHLGFSFP